MEIGTIVDAGALIGWLNEADQWHAWSVAVLCWRRGPLRTTVSHPFETKFYGDRSGGIIDPFGHHWHIGTHVEDVSPEEIQRRMAGTTKGYTERTVCLATGGRNSRMGPAKETGTSEVRRRLDLQIDPATVRRFAPANGLAPSKPAPKPMAAVRRWQCSKIGALWQLDATPHCWWPDGPMLPLLNMLDDCSRRVGARIHAAENLPAYLDLQPRAFLGHGLPLRLYVNCHSFFLSSVPDALTQLGTSLHFYDVTFRYAPSLQAKGKIERRHDHWQKRLSPLLAADQILTLESANAHEIHRELGSTPAAARAQALAENRSELRPPPACQWWRFLWSLRTTIRVADDGKAPIRNLRLSVDAPPRSRLIHCLLPDGDIFLLKSPPSKNFHPVILLHSPIF